MTDDPVTKVARDLTEIENLTRALEEQVTHKATDRLMPGGRAMVALGPDADLDEWAEQIAYAELHHYAACDKDSHKDCTIAGAEHVEDEDDQWSEDPLRSLLFWTDEWRRERGYPLDGRSPTLLTEAAFLRNCLTWAWDNEPHFEDLARDVNRARQALELTVNAGRHVERSRVVCPDCPDDRRLIKVHGPLRTIGYRCRACGTGGIISPDATHCANPWCWTPLPPAPILASDSREDRWKCTNCKRRFDAADARDALAKQLRSQGAERYVSWADAVSTLRAQGRAKRTVYKWLEPTVEHEADVCTECGERWEPSEYPACPAEIDDEDECGGLLRPVYSGDPDAVVEGWCEVKTRRTFVWWPDLWRRHLSTPTRKRQSA